MACHADLRTFGWSYNQRGVVATVETAQPHSTAWQIFLPTGPLALLPARAGFSNVVWSTDPQHAQQLESLSQPDFAAAVNTVRGRAEKLQSVLAALHA